MNKRRILLFGKNGQVGWELQRSLAPLGEVLALGHRDTQPCGDLEDLAGIRETVRAIKPEVVVNAAAYTAVDRAESEQPRAHQVNAEAPAVLAEAAAALGAWCVHYSTEFVFDGSGMAPWRETDPTSPLGAYGRSKLAGEQAVIGANDRHLVFRTSWVHAARGHNFLRTVLRQATERERLTIVNDQHGAPTSAELIADVTAIALRQVLEERGGGGLYHLSASGETTWHGLATHVVHTARRLRPALKLAVSIIEPVPTSAYPTPARRPLNSRLATARLEETFGLRLPPWPEGVDRSLAEIL